MGFGANAICFLLAAREAGVDFARAATLGRQRLHLSPAALRRTCARMGEPLDRATADALFTHAGGYADALLARLGARQIESIDASPYEGASILHDLNAPLPDALKARFSVVIDGGTLEHVFDVPAALRNCMQMLVPGGHFLGISPANSQMGHGFYQFSPELFYRVFSADNGFIVDRMFVCEEALISRFRWYAVRDPLRAGRRVTLDGRPESTLLVQARKLRETPIFAHPPQQSDYAAAWAEADAARAGVPAATAAGHAGPTAAAKAWALRHAPELVVRARRAIRFVQRSRFEKQVYASVRVRRGLGTSADARPWND